MIFWKRWFLKNINPGSYHNKNYRCPQSSLYIKGIRFKFGTLQFLLDLNFWAAITQNWHIIKTKEFWIISFMFWTGISILEKQKCLRYSVLAPARPLLEIAHKIFIKNEKILRAYHMYILLAINYKLTSL